MMNQKVQVVIVGAGPTGLSLAAQLLRYQINFIIIEKNEKTTPFSKALVIQARTLEIFKEIGLSEKAIAEGKITAAMNFFHNGRQMAAVRLGGLGEGLSPFPFALSFEQSKTEQLLVDYLAKEGMGIYWKSEFIRFEQTTEGVVVYYKNANQVEQTIEAEYIIGCDGPGSLVRHQMGSSFEGDTVPRTFYVADIELESPVINKDELFMFVIEKGFLLFFPMKGRGNYRIVGILPEKTEGDKQIQFSDIARDIKEQIRVPVDFGTLKWFSSYRVHSRKASSFMNSRCFIAGDAAHIHTPAGGQGMNTGIQDAYNVAWKLAYSIRYNVNPLVLESYNTERMENASHLLRTTDRMFDLMAGSSTFWNFVRMHVFPYIINLVSKSAGFKRFVFPLISQTGIAYPNSALTIKSRLGRVRAGDRMPHFVFSNGDGIFNCLEEPRFKLLFFGDNEKNAIKEIDPGKLQIAALSFNEIPQELFKSAKNFYILLRPDNHIAYIGKDINGCRILFHKIL
jgi:2-polyprenyl-6-methoxyphenol hydroxylase-like FAD-dependent oxidoreductase